MRDFSFGFWKLQSDKNWICTFSSSIFVNSMKYTYFTIPNQFLIRDRINALLAVKVGFRMVVVDMEHGESLFISTLCKCRVPIFLFNLLFDAFMCKCLTMLLLHYLLNPDQNTLANGFIYLWTRGAVWIMLGSTTCNWY